MLFQNHDIALNNELDKYTLPIRTINLIEGMTPASSCDSKRRYRKPPIDRCSQLKLSNVYETTNDYRRYMHKT